MKAFIYILILLVFSACAEFQVATLTQELPLVHLDSATMNAPSLPVMNFNNGVFYDQKSDISKWESSHGNISLGKTKNALMVDLKEVGADWEQLSCQFQSVNFSEAPYLLVKARIDANSPDSLKLRIDLIDDEGYATNYIPQERYIRSRPEMKIYKFNYMGNWTQNWPSRKEVNSKNIVEMRINFNGGGPNYSGKLFIEEIIAFDGKRKETNLFNYALFDFSEGTSSWWSANSIVITNEEINSKDVMKLVLDEVGPGWEGFGSPLERTIDFSITPILKIRLKADKPGKLRIDLIDDKNLSTNAIPLLIDFPATEEYVDLFYNYSAKFNQSWPVKQEVDSTKIKSIKFHVNPPENPAFKGTILIDDIYLLSIEEYNKLQK